MHIYHGIYHNTYHHIYHGIYHDIYYGIYYGIYHAPVEAIMQLIASLSSTAPYSMVSSTFLDIPDILTHLWLNEILQNEREGEQ